MPCHNREAEEEASAFPHPCRDEPPIRETESSAIHNEVQNSTNKAGFPKLSTVLTKVNFALILSSKLLHMFYTVSTSAADL